MKVSELAGELGVPPSVVIEQCQRFGIDATWAEAELSGADVVVLRAELAAADLDPGLPVAPGAGDAEADDGMAGGDADPSATAPLPPTAVGSRPDLIDEVTPEPAEESSAAPGGGPKLAGAGMGPDISAGPRRIPPRPAPEKRRFDPAIRSAGFALGFAVVALAVSNLADLAVAVALLWLVGAISLVVCLVFCYRAYRHITTHPERLRGLGVVAVLSVVAVIGGLLLGLGVKAAVGDAPADDAPLGLGELASVQDARWGYARVARIVDNGWKQPAKDEGTCWVIDDDVDGTDGRVETHTDKTYCTRRHTLEVIDVWAWNRDADAPYPGPEAFLKAVGKRCGDVVDDLVADADVAALNPTLGAEYPTEDGWFDGDHDVACVVVTEPTEEGLVS